MLGSSWTRYMVVMVFGKFTILSNVFCAISLFTVVKNLDISNLSKITICLHCIAQLLICVILTSFQEMREAIKDEIEAERHGGIFMLIIMTHGTRNNLIWGSDNDYLQLAEIYDLLSATNAPNLKGVPKWVVISACRGGEDTIIYLLAALIICVSVNCINRS